MTSPEFEEIIKRTKKIVLSAIAKNLSDNYTHAIDDVVQETYLRAYKSLESGKFRGDSQIGTWLYKIAKNESQRMNAKLDKEEIKKQKLVLEINTLESVENTDNEDRLIKFFHFLSVIPEKYSEVLKNQLAGKTEKDISKSLGISKGTVKSRASRGKDFIRKLFSKEEL